MANEARAKMKMSVSNKPTRPENMPPTEVVFRIMMERSRQIKAGQYKD